MLEIWKDIPGYEGKYAVSSLGRVRNFDRKSINNRHKEDVYIKGGIMKSSLSFYGYMRVTLTLNKKQTTRSVHSLVAETFLGHSANGHEMVIDHINNIRSDNRLCNLQIITNRENSSKDKEGYTSEYIGVSWDSWGGKWAAGIRANGKHLHLGRFSCELKASSCYQRALVEVDAGRLSRKNIKDWLKADRRNYASI